MYKKFFSSLRQKMHLHKIEYDYGFFGLGVGWHCAKCGKLFNKKPLIILLTKILFGDVKTSKKLTIKL